MIFMQSTPLSSFSFSKLLVKVSRISFENGWKVSVMMDLWMISSTRLRNLCSGLLLSKAMGTSSRIFRKIGTMFFKKYSYSAAPLKASIMSRSSRSTDWASL